MQIFISIASYQDPLLLETICSAYKNAKYKSGLRFGVCDQSDKGIDIESLDFSNQIEYELINPVIAKGPCWARERIQQFFKDEDFYLQVDSHTLFSKDWDEILISYFNWLQFAECKDIVITGYPRSFKPNKSLTVFNMNTTFKGTLGITFREGRIFEDRHFSMQKSFPANSNKPVKGLLIAAGFIFTSGKFVRAIPYDPNFYFHGEELSIALRIFTNDWVVIHIPRVPLFHLYTDVDNLLRKLHWNPEDEKNRVIKWNKLDDISKERLSLLVNNKINNVFGLGYKRSIDEFSDLCGLDFKNKETKDLNRATANFPFFEVESKETPFKSIEISNE
jgi:hypothetical protein